MKYWLSLAKHPTNNNNNNMMDPILHNWCKQNPYFIRYEKWENRLLQAPLTKKLISIDFVLFCFVFILAPQKSWYHSMILSKSIFCLCPYEQHHLSNYCLMANFFIFYNKKNPWHLICSELRLTWSEKIKRLIV